MSQPIRVVLVDDHRMFRSGVRSELAEEAADGIEIVGEAPDVETAVSVIKAEQPDVVLLDVHLPGGLGHGGVDVLRGCVAQESQRLSIAVFRLCGVSGMARVDFFLERGTDRVLINEINTLPGFTAISMYPKLWEASGVPLPALLDELVRLALERHARRARLLTRPPAELA